MSSGTLALNTGRGLTTPAPKNAIPPFVPNLIFFILDAKILLY